MIEKIKLFLNTIIFNSFFDNKIKSESIRRYLKEFFLIKTILIKVIGLILIALTTSLIFFLVRDGLLKNPSANLVFNRGVAFSILSNANDMFIYVLKSLISTVFLLIFIFNNKWYLNLSACLIALNGWYNVIDKSMVDIFDGNEYVNTVVDYINFGSSVANSADIFITIGICLFVIGILFYVYYSYKNEKNH